MTVKAKRAKSQVLTPTFADDLRCFDLKTHVILSHYGDDEETSLAPSTLTEATYISSRTTSGESHMVLLDVDGPVTLAMIAGTPTLTFHDEVFAFQARRAIRAFTEAYLADPTQAMDAISLLPRWGRGPVNIPLRVAPEVVASKTPGHFHLYFERPVTWATYSRLLRELARARVIDRYWAGTTLRMGTALLRNPNQTVETKK